MSQMLLQERLATRIGLHPAIMLMKVRSWTRTNEKNGKQKKDGRCWMYNSIAAWHEEIPYLSEKQIRTAMAYLRDNGYLLAEKARKHQWNQTMHYALSDLAMEVFQEIEAYSESVSADSAHPSNQFALQGNSLCPDREIDLPLQANGTNALPNALPCNEMIPSPPCSEVIPHDVFMERLEAWNISEAEMRDFLDRTGRPEAWAYQWLGIMEEDIRSGRVSEYRSPFGALMERHKGNWPFPRAVRSADLPETKALQKAVETTRCRMLEELESINPDPTTSPFWKLHQKYMAPVPIVT